MRATTLSIQRQGSGPYVQSGTFDGTDLGGKAYLTTAEVHTAGSHLLVLTMGKAPGTAWGTKRPPF